jgi:aldose 1-epimerase
MAGEGSPDAALRPLEPGPLIELSTRALRVQVAPGAGGRIAQITCDGLDWLCGHAPGNEAAIAWGCYPMLPWAGRLRHGQFRFDTRQIQLPVNLGAHAAHGIGFVLPWQVQAQSAATLQMSLQLPRDERWPFGGTAQQRIAVADRSVRLELSLTAQEQAMPRPVLGWHPWFVKPERLDFLPTRCYPRDAQGIATRPLVEPPWDSPWDDCFINSRPVELGRAGRTLRLSSNCNHWVVYDERAYATCVEPQSGPPDAFNLEPGRLAAGETVTAWCHLEWTEMSQS